MTDSPGTVVVVDDDPAFGHLVSRLLATAGYRVELFESGEACLDGLGRVLPDVVCLDVTLPGMDGIETLARIREHHPLLPVVMLTAATGVDTIKAAIQRGAYDYLSKPIDRPKLETTVKNAVEKSRLALRLAQLEREAESDEYGPLVGRSPAMRELFRQLDRVASSDITVLVRGESGTGKELVARAIHGRSGRARRPIVAVNCAAIPDTLQESELFGHERGAFTGATDRRIGRFEQADGGTLFLDEVAELSLPLQAKLLRVLQSRAFHRVGGASEIRSDFRLIAATHQTLTDLVRAGRFREDLFFRIAVFEIEVPPLRARAGDIPLLVRRLAGEIGAAEGRAVELSPAVVERLSAYEWPGNVRELQNALHRAVVSAGGGVVQPADLPPAMAGVPVDPLPRPDVVAERATAGEAATVAALPTLNLDALERAAIEAAIQASGGNLTRAMRTLGIGRTTLYRKLRQFGIPVAR